LAFYDAYFQDFHGPANALDIALQEAPNFKLDSDHEQMAVCLLEVLEHPLRHRFESNLVAAAGQSTAIIEAIEKSPCRRSIELDNSFSKGRLTALHWAARAPTFRPDVMDMLLHRCGIDVDVIDVNGMTPAHLAAWHGNVAQLRWFIEAGVDIDCVDDDGHTLLQFACANAQVDSARFLMALEADGFARPGTMIPAEQPHDPDDDDCQTIDHMLIAHGYEIDDSVSDADSLEVEQRRQDIADARHELLRSVRRRALQVCIGLHNLRLDALQMCEILQFASCGALAALVPFHQWWAIATTVKHFRDKTKRKKMKKRGRK
jgi:hypothetical protein